MCFTVDNGNTRYVPLSSEKVPPPITPGKSRVTPATAAAGTREWLRACMAQRQWSAAELSRRAGVPAATISRILSGKRAMGQNVAFQLSRALEEPRELAYPVTSSAPTPRPDRSSVEVREVRERIREKRLSRLLRSNARLTAELAALAEVVRILIEQQRLILAGGGPWRGTAQGLEPPHEPAAGRDAPSNPSRGASRSDKLGGYLAEGA